MAERMVSPDDRDLDRALADLAAHVAYPPTPDLATGVLRRLSAAPARPRPFAVLLTRLRRRRETRLQPQALWRLAIAAVVLIVAAGTLVAVSPDVRTAIAERLGLRGVQIQQVPSIPTQSAPPAGPSPAAGASLSASPTAPNAASPGAASPTAASPSAGSAGSRLNLGQPMTLAQARVRVAYSVQVPTALGAPDEVYLLDPPPGGQVALVYYPRPDLPQASTTRVGLLLTEFLGNVHATGVVGKGLPPGTHLEDIQVNESRGYWIDGDPHAFFYLDARGQVRTETTRLAGTVLLWEHGDVTYRLEAALAKNAALQIAVSVP